MSNLWIERWNDRYSAEAFAYGELPNNYLQAQLAQLPAGKILFPAEGEGRNAVFAATQGWDVSAFDISEAGRRKAMRLAATHGVTIAYDVAELQALPYVGEQFDAVALIYAHFPAAIKSAYHRQISAWVRKGGYVIFEAFSKNHLAYNAQNEAVGGPKEIDMLFSVAEIEADFAEYEILELAEQEIELHEGLYHNGIGSVIRFLGRKKG